TGGTVDASGSVIIGKSGGGTGQYTMGGGKLTAQKVLVRKGTLTVAGPDGEVLLADYEQQATATLESEITGGGIALIDISGRALLDGAWSVVDSHSRYGRFEILRALGGIEGTFSSVTLPEVPFDEEWIWGIDQDVLWVEYTPEPATFALLAFGGLAVMRRRNR
ncbi:MAG TPA: PEP-CTERM sorting domain-containing protein, partial [Phycisphaerae bacterium]|nr:PEP-CTERM sorting domain-containing protein [Phycisphaerae bacterium]